MYQVYFGDRPIYDLRDESLIIREPDVHLAVGEAGEMSFIIDPDHPNIGALSKLKGTLKLTAGGSPIFKGRIIRDSRDFFLSRKIEVEGLLACLNDSLIPPYSFPDDWRNDEAYTSAETGGNVIAFFLGWLLDQHNSQTSESQHILLGDVTVTDPNNYISRESSKYTTTMEAVRSKLVDLLGGHLLVDYSGEIPVLNYYADLPYVNAQTVQYGENLLDLLHEEDAADVYTAILPVGKDGLTIAELEDGEISPGYWKQGNIIYSAEAEEHYGARITRSVEWEGVTTAANLQSKALAQIQTDGASVTRTITIKAVDLGMVQEEKLQTAAAIAGRAVAGDSIVGAAQTTDTESVAVSRFIVGRYVKIESAPHGFSAIYPLMELEPDILNPGNTRITLGAIVKSASVLARNHQS